MRKYWRRLTQHGHFSFVTVMLQFLKAVVWGPNSLQCLSTWTLRSTNIEPLEPRCFRSNFNSIYILSEVRCCVALLLSWYFMQDMYGLAYKTTECASLEVSGGQGSRSRLQWKRLLLFSNQLSPIHSVVPDKSLFEWEKGEKVCVICLIQFIRRASSINHVVVMIFFFLVTLLP